MRSPFRFVAAFATGPLRRGTAQIVMSVTAGVCVALVTQALVPERRPATTEVQRQAEETVTPRDDRLPKAVVAAPAAAIDESEMASTVRTESVTAETHVAKLPAVEPRADYRAPASLDGPHPYTPPMASNEPLPAPAILDYAPLASGGAVAPAIAGVDDALRPPADIGAPGQPMVLTGAVPPDGFASDDFDVDAPPAAETQRRVPLLALPFNAVEQGVFRLGDVVASIGKPDRRY